MHYEYADKPVKVVTCGLHGRTYGERPFSMVKRLAFAGIVSAMADCSLRATGKIINDVLTTHKSHIFKYLTPCPHEDISKLRENDF
jgi:hypothetical protein